MQKTFILVTNYREGEPISDRCNTVVVRTTITSKGVVVRDGPEGEKGMFTIDAYNEAVVLSWGIYGPLSKDEAKRLGGDFGIWFIS
jgi:hypothetical protein